MSQIFFTNSSPFISDGMLKSVRMSLYIASLFAILSSINLIASLPVSLVSLEIPKS